MHLDDLEVYILTNFGQNLALLRDDTYVWQNVHGSLFKTKNSS